MTHDELVKMINPIIDKMNEAGFNYFFIAGKDNISARYYRGKKEDIKGILVSLAGTQPEFKEIIKEANNETKN